VWRAGDTKSRECLDQEKTKQATMTFQANPLSMSMSNEGFDEWVKGGEAATERERKEAAAAAGRGRGRNSGGGGGSGGGTGANGGDSRNSNGGSRRGGGGGRGGDGREGECMRRAAR
jgi:hypothetical protein